jgi:phosphodiesterase/alkaline phosphatase D-like protein
MNPGTTYYYQVVGQNSAGTVAGSVNHFTTTQPSTPPTVTTGSASGITNNGVTTYGTVNPNGSDTHVWFLIATNSGMSGAVQTPAYDAGSGTTTLQIQCAWTGLAAGTTYYYQFVAQNGAGTVKGTVNQFTTVRPSSPPTVSTGSAGGITTNSAVVYGNVNPNGSDTNVWFLIATNPAMSGAVQSPSYDAGSGNASLQIQCTWTGLSPNRTYYYQFVAQNNSGTAKGVVMNFKTMAGAGLPIVSTSSATSIAATTATINGTVNPNGADTIAWFQIAVNSSMSGGVQSNAVDLGSGNTTYQIQCAITGMSPGGTYYYRILARNSYGTVQGSVMHFTTSTQSSRGPTAGERELGLRAISPTVLGSMGPTGGNLHVMAGDRAKSITGVVQAPSQEPGVTNAAPSGLSAGATSLSGSGAKPRQRANPRK